MKYQPGLNVIGRSQGQINTPRRNCEAHDIEMLTEWPAQTDDLDDHQFFHLIRHCWKRRAKKKINIP